MMRKIPNAGFTLPELLAVIAIVASLMMASFGSLQRARHLAKRTKAEAQLRELVNAWEQYFVTYSAWPSNLDGQNGVDTTARNLAPLTSPNDVNNSLGIVFLNFDGTGSFTDPWGKAYKLSFESSRRQSGSDDRSKTAFETTVALPRRFTMMP